MGNYLDTATGRNETHERMRRIALHDAYYKGSQYADHREWRSLLGYRADVDPPTIIVNYPRLIIDRPSHFAFDRVRGAESADESAQAFLSDVVSATNLLERLGELCVEASVKGDALLTFEFEPDNPDNPFPIRMVRAEDYTVEVDPHNSARILFIRIEYRYVDEEGAERWHREEIYPDRTATYRGEPVRGKTIWGSGSALGMLGIAPEEPVEWRLTALKKNPFGFIPAVLVRNCGRSGTVYGESDLSDLLTIFDDINWKLSQRSRNISRTMNAILKNINGRILNEYISEDAVLNVIGENAQVGYLVNDADMSEIATHISDLRRALSEISGVTMIDPEKYTGFGAASGFALSMLYEPLIALSEKKRRTIGGAVERFLSMILKAAGALGILETELESTAVSLTYGAMFRSTESELFDRQARLLAGLEAGVISKESVMQKLGGE